MLNHVQFFTTTWTAACQATLSFTISQTLFKSMSIKSVMLSNNLCHPLLLLLSVFPSIRVFSNESTLRIRWPKYRSFTIVPSSEYSGLISFRIDWFELLTVQGTLKSLLQHASKFGKLSSGHGTGKGQFSFQSQRKAMPKNIQTTAQLH